MPNFQVFADGAGDKRSFEVVSFCIYLVRSVVEHLFKRLEKSHVCLCSSVSLFVHLFRFFHWVVGLLLLIEIQHLNLGPKKQWT